MSGDDKVLERLWATTRRPREASPDETAAPPKSSAEAPDDLGPVFSKDRVYKAYDIISRAQRLHIIRATRMARRPAYHYLADIVEDRFQHSSFALIYPTMIVKATGRNLGPVMDAIGAGTCGRIREYHAKLYDPPRPGEPVIEEITIIAADEQPDN